MFFFLTGQKVARLHIPFCCTWSSIISTYKGLWREHLNILSINLVWITDHFLLLPNFLVSVACQFLTRTLINRQTRRVRNTTQVIKAWLDTLTWHDTDYKIICKLLLSISASLTRKCTFNIVQSSVNVSMWFIWIITGLRESYKVLHRISNNELNRIEEIFISFTRNC